jgi:heme/copper-type cytochrome/quinol oxidase subunit 3
MTTTAVPTRTPVHTGGGAGDGGGNGNGGDGPIGEGDRIPISEGKLAMMILLSSLVMLFAGFVTAYVVLRFSSPTWPPPGAPALPRLLFATTLVLITSSGTIAWAASSARGRRGLALRVALTLTLLLGALFVLGQLLAWQEMFKGGVTIKGSYGTVFYSLTGLHAAHVLGGLVLLLVVLTKALLGRYDQGSPEGVELAAMYWHFLDVVWIVLFWIL